LQRHTYIDITSLTTAEVNVNDSHSPLQAGIDKCLIRINPARLAPYFAGLGSATTRVPEAISDQLRRSASNRIHR